MSDFVDRIDSLLSQHNKNRNDIYNDLGIAKNIIGQWKQRGTIPSADTALKIAQYLNTTVEYLLTGKESDEYKNKYDGLVSEIKDFADKL